MLKKMMYGAGIAALLALSLPAAANAVTEGYTPSTPTAPSLAGSLAGSTCLGDVPWISYSVELTDPDNQIADESVTLELKNGANSVTLPLGDLQDDALQGRILWPGAVVENGDAVGWPGWELANGEWVETPANFAWTRGDITAVIHAGADLAVPLTYPASSTACASPAGMVASAGGFALPLTAPEGLALTGDNRPVVAGGIIGGVLVVGGAALLIARRVRRN